MATTEEHIIDLSQQMNAMQADVAELPSALQGSALRYSELLVHLVR